MDHLAIMKKAWKLTGKILTGQKTIESRWYVTRRAPWNIIQEGEKVYFKDSGEPVTIVAEVEKVLQFSELTPRKVRRILEEYGPGDGIAINDLDKYYNMFKDKRYCILVFLRKPRKVEPFKIDKSGFGNMAAWICVDDIRILQNV
ncbi:MAG: ASCH domain-containing protein [Candidatus Woesearchaeota archaeon]